MIESWLAMPTAVMTESSEKTMSSSRIWTSTQKNAARAPARRPAPWGSASTLLVDLPRGLEDEEEAAAQQDQVAAGDAAAEHGDERLGEAHDPRDREEQADADAEGEDEAEAPRDARAGPSGRRATRIAMKTTLSMPSTISMAESVARARRGRRW